MSGRGPFDESEAKWMQAWSLFARQSRSDDERKSFWVRFESDDTSAWFRLHDWSPHHASQPREQFEVALVAHYTGSGGGNDQPVPVVSDHVVRCRRVLDFAEVLIPRRLVIEDVGDTWEVLDRLDRQGAAAWKIYVKLMSACGFLALNALREVTSALMGRPSRARDR